MGNGDTKWVIKGQTISPDGNTFGTITAMSSGKWSYNGS